MQQLQVCLLSVSKCIVILFNLVSMLQKEKKNVHNAYIDLGNERKCCISEDGTSEFLTDLILKMS